VVASQNRTKCKSTSRNARTTASGHKRERRPFECLPPTRPVYLSKRTRAGTAGWGQPWAINGPNGSAAFSLPLGYFQADDRDSKAHSTYAMTRNIQRKRGGLLMIVSWPIFEAHLECLTKCWLRSRDEPRAGNAYAEWARLRETTYSEDCLRHLRTTFPECDHAKSPPIPGHVRTLTWRLATDVLLHSNRLESRLHALARKPSERPGGQAQFIPYRFQFSNQVTKNDKLLLVFDALVLKLLDVP
jgi:hypothetical protein